MRSLFASLLLLLAVSSNANAQFDPLNLVPRFQRFFQQDEPRYESREEYRAPVEYAEPRRARYAPMRPTLVRYNLPANTIYVDHEQRMLYLGLGDGTAIRYAIGVGRPGIGWTGDMVIGAMKEWPSWTPTESMIAKKPKYAQYRGGLPGGPENPLGARALYLYGSYQENGQTLNPAGGDSMFRIHGTNDPESIGLAESSGCFRMMNEDVKDLYRQVNVGTRVIVR